MARIFNITGPCLAGKHYMLPPADRVDDVHPLINQEEYFVIHAPRQSGKTTFYNLQQIPIKFQWPA